MDELTRLLLAQIAGTGDASAALSLPDVVQQSLGDDPLAVPLATALRERAERAAAEEAQEAETDAEVAELLERLYAEVEALRARTHMLADALGACPRCFGEDELCAVCRGRGVPGGRRPDATLFAELVEPAVRRHEGLLAEEAALAPLEGTHRP